MAYGHCENCKGWNCSNCDARPRFASRVPCWIEFNCLECGALIGTFPDTSPLTVDLILCGVCNEG